MAARIPQAKLSFAPDPQVMSLLKEIGQMQISEEKARKEWGWKIAYNLDEMVDDFIQEFHRHSSGRAPTSDMKRVGCNENGLDPNGGPEHRD